MIKINTTQLRQSKMINPLKYHIVPYKKGLTEYYCE